MITINLKKFPKWKLLHAATPIHFAKNISKLLGVELYIKRDDLSDIGLGGNKLRKLEYLLGEAKNLGATHVLTLGAMQSNHARLTAVAGKMAGFEVELFLKKSVAIESRNYTENGNILLERILGVKNHYIPNDGYTVAKVEQRLKEIDKAGGCGYFIPVGGSNALGTLGYLDCFFEILQQQQSIKTIFDHIALATGSGGTHAGIVLGKLISSSAVNIHAYNVQPEEEELVAHTEQILKDAMVLVNRPIATEHAIRVESAYSGQEYGIPEDYHIHSIKLLAKLDGIFLDPVYTGKAFSGLLTDIRQGRIAKGEKVLFIHTGGIPGLFAYDHYF